ncbi:MAG: hypothetical protein AAF903_02070 [Pseudomonadota bacterium]
MTHDAVTKLKAALSRVEGERFQVSCEGAVAFAPEDEGARCAWRTGVDAIDTCLPRGGLARAGLHEIEPLKPDDMPSLTGFAFALLCRLGSARPIIWCVTARQIGDYGQPYAFGLSRFGLSSAQIVFVKVAREKDLPFALEEAIKTKGVAAVLGEGARPDLTGSRRLALLCKTHQTPCLFMSPHKDGNRGSAALTRWEITPQMGLEDPRDPFGPGLSSWLVALPRARGGRTLPGLEGSELSNPSISYPWRIVWDEQTHSFCSASLFSDRAAPHGGTKIQPAPETILGKTG